jgi:hypothetical protein
MTDTILNLVIPTEAAILGYYSRNQEDQSV